MQRDLGEIKRELEAAAAKADGFVELRYHRKKTRTAGVENGRVEVANARHREGVGVRVIEDGCFGFASCGSADGAGPRRRDRAGPRRGPGLRRPPAGAASTPSLPPTSSAATSTAPSSQDCDAKPFEEKVELARGMEAHARASAGSISSATCVYTEIFEEKAIVTTDGASASFRLVRPEFRVSAVADAERRAPGRHRAASARPAAGTACSGARARRQLAEQSAQTAVDLLVGPAARGRPRAP